MIAETVETALEGRTATTVLRDIKTYNVFVRLQERFRDDPAKAGAILIDTPAGAKVKLAQVAHIWQDTGPMIINRENLQRRMQLTCNIAGANIQDVVAQIRAKLGDLHLPKGYTVAFGGNYARQRELNRQILTMIVISLLIVFMLLLSAFNSVWQAVLIIFTIPLALMGGVWAMFLTFETFNVSSLIGVVAHFGLTVQKGVILVEYINDLRKEGMPLQEAVVMAGKTRMRPVLMTALAASLGVLPLALGVGAGAEIQQPMAIVLIGGLIVSTPIVLVLLPVLYGRGLGFLNKA
jgi:cobalt-zinc-cadmium resistance protein CzcA